MQELSSPPELKLGHKAPGYTQLTMKVDSVKGPASGTDKS